VYGARVCNCDCDSTVSVGEVTRHRMVLNDNYFGQTMRKWSENKTMAFNEKYAAEFQIITTGEGILFILKTRAICLLCNG